MNKKPSEVILCRRNNHVMADWLISLYISAVHQHFIFRYGLMCLNPPVVQPCLGVIVSGINLETFHTTG